MTDIFNGELFTYFDIETIPCQAPEYLDDLRKTVAAPARLSKPESIEKWLHDNREKAAKESLEKTSFDGGRGHVCTISWAKNDGLIKTLHAHQISDERGIVKGFFESLDLYHSETLVGHYITGFDIQFLTKRAIVLGVELPPNSAFPRDPKPWGKGIHDTMTMWAGVRDRISLDALCNILGIPGKGDFDGSMVADAWANGRHKKIAEYCADDVSRTREIHKRFLKAGW